MARFDSLKYAVHKIGDESVDKAFPDLFKKPEFKKIRGRPDYNRLTKYICYLYDKNTDLTHEFPKNLQARKDEAAKEAGYERTNGKWPKQIQDVMDIKDKDATSAIFIYLKDQKYYIWTEIVVTEQELDEFQRIRFASVSNKSSKKGGKVESEIIDAANKKDKLKEACDSRIKSLETLYKQFFEDHMELKQAEFEEQITPENAERILAKETPPWEEEKAETQTPHVSSD
jgi:hypothetical protein